jgi:peptidoglycan hydrolase CwlO-like protein
MSTLKELEKLQTMRAELEAESRSLKEKQKELESSLLALEQEVVMEELNKEKAVIEELKNSNKATKDAIAQLEAKKRELETKLPQKPATPPPAKEKKEEAPAQPEETEEAEESGVTVTAIEGEALVESPEAVGESPKKQEKKKRRFF